MKDAPVATIIDAVGSAQPYAKRRSDRCADPRLQAVGALPFAITDVEVLVAVLLILMIPGLLSYLVPVRRRDEVEKRGPTWL
jgi:hypothetical protein